MKLHTPFTVDGHPILGTYVAQTVDDLKLVKDVGMNIVLGGHEHLDPKTEQGRFCRENGIKVLHHLTQHVYNKPRLLDRVDSDQTTIPVNPDFPGKFAESGTIQLDDELVKYGATDGKSLLRCERGFRGTRRAEHRPGMIAFFPDDCANEIEEVRNSPNLWGYYVLDDSPGDAVSALRAMYRLVKRLDPDHPVTAGYGSAGSLCNFGPDVCDIMLFYWYPVDSFGTYRRDMTSHEVQWMLSAARKQVPGVPFAGVYQTFDASFEAGKPSGKGLPTSAQVREQIEDFVREGCCGLISFLCNHSGLAGWATNDAMKAIIRETHREIRETGGVSVRPEPTELARARVQPQGFWHHPRDIPGIVPAWYVAAPFVAGEEKRLDAVFPPERGVDLNAAYEGKSGPVRWIRRLSFGGCVGLGELFGPHSYTAGCTAYATCEVTSPREQEVQMRIGSDDDMAVWLNGKQAVWRVYAGGLRRDAEVHPAMLPEGRSRILVKVYNRAGMWGFFVRFTDRDGKPLDGLTFDPADQG